MSIAPRFGFTIWRSYRDKSQQPQIEKDSTDSILDTHNWPEVDEKWQKLIMTNH